ncbi:ubiquitin-conjugating enzyme E2 [Pseudooceanicola sp. LIPI14-2-Ac024]|uniref:ubiquitin-conjugating enzyme E2 n=1 Tax=Pseudooceanicola sp. LIPI14-2-Ac024 TaxID=3344875 RepID=UPI0035CFBFBD
MSAFDERRGQDIEKLRTLAAGSGGKVEVLSAAGQPVNLIRVRLKIKTAGTKSYPRDVQTITDLTIKLPARYPFVEPQVQVDTPILHPNVYASGQICLGVKWMPSQGLDLLIKRVAKIIAYDADVLNEQSPANSDALRWYRGLMASNPGAFPSDSSDLKDTEVKRTLKWGNIPADKSGKTVVSCPKCSAKLSLPAGKSGLVKCPKCDNKFDVKT